MPSPSPSAAQRPRTVQDALEGALIALRANDPVEAERLAAYVLNSNRAHALAAKTLGQALLMQGRFEEAVEPLRQAARRSEEGEAETLLARALAEAGRPEEAIDHLRRAITRRPVFPLAFLELADRLAQADRAEEGVAVLEDGLVLAPGVLDLKVALGYLHLNLGRRAQALEAFSQVRAAAPHRGDALLGSAHALAASANHEAAADLFRHILAHRPDDGVTRMALAKSLFALGDRAGGETALRVATRGGTQGVAEAIRALAEAPHGRVFLRPSAALAFLQAGPA